jgi:hypothetical protein
MVICDPFTTPMAVLASDLPRMAANSTGTLMEQQDVVMQEESVSEINHFDVQVEAPMSRHVKTKKQTWKLPIPGDIAGHGP